MSSLIIRFSVIPNLIFLPSKSVKKFILHIILPFFFFQTHKLTMAGYGKGGVMLKISDDGRGITEIWRDTVLQNRMAAAVIHNDKIYGASDKPKKWVCLDANTGSELYSAVIIRRGNIIFADEMLYLYGEDGNVGLVNPKSNDFKLVSSFKVPYGNKQHWAHLVINKKRLLVRHGNSLMVFSIADK